MENKETQSDAAPIANKAAQAFDFSESSSTNNHRAQFITVRDSRNRRVEGTKICS